MGKWFTTKMPKTTQQFSANISGNIAMCKKMKLDPYVTPYSKTNSNRWKDLCEKTKNIKLLEENTEGKLHDTGFGNDFLAITSETQATKKKNWEVGLYQN